ncbi:MAG: hypothetical protein IK078_11635 [Lachnospiraceae bacterium]|nr:hypothetical protein [Lachnospiraceae bacterium]
MADSARKWTDKKLALMEKRLAETYRKASPSVSANFRKYIKENRAELDELYEEYLDTKEEQALKRYQSKAREKTVNNRNFQRMVAGTAVLIMYLNRETTDYVNRQMPDIYRHNNNQIDQDIRFLSRFLDLEKSTHHTTATEAVQRVESNRDKFLRILNEKKDMLWNSREINKIVASGIAKGESIDKIADSVFPEIMSRTDTTGMTEEEKRSIIHKNEVSARRTARTMVTYAENRARLERYFAYEEDGVVVMKVWLATPDGRTRDWHLDMDGQEVLPHEYFIDGLGNELEEPGDTGAPPETVYNCRCAMTSHIIGVRQADGSIYDLSHYGKTTDFHAEQIAEERKRREKKEDEEED